MRQAGLPAQSVRRQLRRPDRQGQGALLRAIERTQQDTTAVGEHAGASSRARMASTRRRTARTLSPARRRRTSRRPVPLGPLRPQHQLPAVRRRAQLDAGQLGRQREQVQLDQRESQLGPGRLEAERVHLPVRRFRQQHRGAQSSAPNQTFPNGVTTGGNINTPQTTEQTEVSSSATTSRGTRPAGAASGTTSKSGSTSSTSRACSSRSTSARAWCSYTHFDNNINGPIRR